MHRLGGVVDRPSRVVVVTLAVVIVVVVTPDRVVVPVVVPPVVVTAVVVPPVVARPSWSRPSWSRPSWSGRFGVPGTGALTPTFPLLLTSPPLADWLTVTSPVVKL